MDQLLLIRPPSPYFCTHSTAEGNRRKSNIFALAALNEHAPSVIEQTLVVPSGSHVSMPNRHRALVGNKGDSYDDALAETINGLYKAELIHRRAP